MTYLKICCVLASALISFYSATAQEAKKNNLDEKINACFNKTTQQLEKVNITDPAAIQPVAAGLLKDDDIITEAIRLLDTETGRIANEIDSKRKEYLSAARNGKHALDKDLLPLLAGIPQPITGLQQAKKEMKPKETIYSSYEEKLKRNAERLRAIIQENRTEEQKNPELAKQAAYKDAEKAEQSLNNNAILQQMGGLEKLKNMSPEQRAALGKEMAEKMKKNPVAYTVNAADPRQAFTQKLLQHPDYAAKYEHMNEEQKKETYQLFVRENGLVDNSSQAGRDKIITERNEAATIVAIEKRISDIRQHAMDMAGLVSRFQATMDDYYNNLNKKLSAAYAERAEALPVKEHGEAGAGKDTYPLDIAYNIVSYPVNAQNAIAAGQVWKQYVEILKITIAEYNEFFADFQGKDQLTERIMRERNYTPAIVGLGICDEMMKLTRSAAFQSNQNASWQKRYDETVAQLYE